MLKNVLNKPILLPFVVSVLVANSVYGAKMISQCDMDHSTKTINGTNINIKYPIASVSKLFTSLIAATTFNLDQSFVTDVYATPVDKNSHDVHISGSNDPYFNRFKLHMIISRLNEAGVRNIRYLTFDENVKYLHETDAYKGFVVGNLRIRPTILKAEMTFPEVELVKKQLQQQPYIISDYPKTYAAAKAAGIALFDPRKARFKVYKTSFLARKDFKPSEKSVKIFVASQDVKTIIKSMNWNSNNFSSNRLLVAAGGLEALNKFYTEHFKVSPSEFEFVNGSGQNHDLKGNGRLYNEASCSVVVRTVRALNEAVNNQQKRIQDVVAVMGTDRGSTVGLSTYTKPQTQGKVVAKTGTVGTNITLGGMINAVTGPHYFFYNVELAAAGRKTRAKGSHAIARFNAQEESRARTMINTELFKLIKKLGGAKDFEYTMSNPLKDNMDNYDEAEDQNLAAGEQEDAE